MKKIYLILFSFFIITSNAQIKFEKGFIIMENGEKKDVLIKNIDWLKNPESFAYKLSENGDIQIGNLDNVASFGVDGYSVYENAIVQIDRSSKNLQNLSSNANPEYSEERHFLKLLVLGTPSLYYYLDSSVSKFFYKDEVGNFVPLINKIYEEKEANQLIHNKSYLNQLSKILKCQYITKAEIEKTDYTPEKLSAIFQKNAACSENFKANTRKIDFNLLIRPRLNMSGAQILINNENVKKFGSKLNIGFGVETEQVLPFNKKKWAIIEEVAFHQYKNEGLFSLSGIPDRLNGEIKFSNIQVSVGARHYIFLSPISRIFLNISIASDIYLNSFYGLKWDDGSYYYQSKKTSSDITSVFGAGYNYNKIGLEFRYFPNRSIDEEIVIGSYYKSFSFIFSYKIF